MKPVFKLAVLPFMLGIACNSWADVTIPTSKPLTNDDIKRELSFLPERDFNRLMNEPLVLANFVDRIDLRRALTIEAERQGLQQTDEFANQLRIAYENILIQMMRDQLSEEQTVPDFTPLARERYQADRKAFVAPETVQARHILLRFENEAEQVSQRAKMEELRSQIVSGELSFADAAKQHSADTGSAQNGGDLGNFTRGQMVKPFEDAAFALEKAGDLSPIVESQFGYHLIQLDKKTSPRQLSFDEVKDQLIAQISDSYAKTSIEERERAIFDKYTSGMDMQELIEFYNLKPANAR